ncbi:MAG: bifunctional riboflavin kinase/FAD synthetase [Desulfobacterota bacterium]|jgi:riboflavin kinase/FMN adenylyltransferase|nr:bifunctional riboflavin kinase/FAD synthetase [Thermodesulfobacteriota bacterium]
MQILINDLAQIYQPFPNPVLTIGNFDGIHLGHQSLFQKVRERARATSGTATVMTFQPHPAAVLRPAKAPRQIIADENKPELIFGCGVEVLLLLPFSWEFAQIPARDFVQKILVEKIGMKEIVIGYDYTFGRKREGNIELLKELGAAGGFAVHIHPPVMVKGQPVSSTRIRELILSGAMEEARALLGRPFSLSGRVIPGQNIGRKVLGFPTANLEPREKLLPQRGVYIVRVETESGAYYGVTNVGFNPTFSGKHISVETYLFDFDQTLYDQLITVCFLKRLRGEKTFAGPEALRAQIQKDVELARECLSQIK